MCIRDSLPADAVSLEFIRGYMYEKTAGNEGMVLMNGEISNETRDLVNRIALGYAVSQNGVISFEGLTAYVYANASGQPGDLVGSFVPYGQGLPPAYPYNGVGLGDQLITHDRRIVLQWVGVDGDGPLPSTGTQYHVIVTPDTVGEDNPLHYTGHPVDFVRNLMDLRQIDYDATSAEAVKAALGQMRVFYRFTEPEPLMDAVEQYAFGPFGFAVRPTVSGEWEFILTRTVPASEPSETLTETTVHDPDTVIFSLAIGQVVNRVVWKQQHWTVWREAMDTEPPPDGIIGREVTTVVEPELDLVADLGVREIVYELPGELIIKSSGTKITATERWYIVTGEDILRRWGRGCPEAEIRALRGHSTAEIGDFIVVDLEHMPTAETGLALPTSKRLREGNTERVVQVIHRTLTPSGPDLRVLDFGPASAVTELIPEFTLALSADDPRHTAEATLTNSGALAGFLVRMEMGTCLLYTSPSPRD